MHFLRMAAGIFAGIAVALAAAGCIGPVLAPTAEPKIEPVIAPAVVRTEPAVEPGGIPDAAPASIPHPNAGKYLFYFIGDGMGHEHVELARRQLGKAADAFDRVPLVGALQTDNAAGKTTDSAAAGTALACGVKTANGYLGMTPDKQPAASIMAAARKAGRRTGIVTSVPLNHATPAAFYAHIDGRGQYDGIARQLATSEIDFLGGGRPILSRDFSEAAWWRLLAENGYTVHVSVSAANIARKAPEGKRLACHDWDYYAIDRDASGMTVRPDLADYTRAAIGELDHPNGFVLMVEGGRIDYAAHRNDGVAMLAEMREFNAAIDMALEFYQHHSEETIVVVTADHNTGGLHFTGPVSSGYGKTEAQVSAERLIRELNKTDMAQWENVLGVLEKLKISFSPEALKAAQTAFATAGQDKRAEATVRALLRERDREANIAWETGGHTSADVDLRILGAGTEAISGTMPNHELVSKLRKVSGLE